jgi:hypothetical protein
VVGSARARTVRWLAVVWVGGLAALAAPRVAAQEASAAGAASASQLAVAPGARWRIGRSPDVFRPDEPVLTTRIGGWADASYEDNDLPSSTRSLNLNHANLFLDTRYGERWQLFGEFEFEHETDLSGFDEESEYEVEQLYGRYRWSDALQLRVGQFNTPFGYWTPVHWSILMDTLDVPLHEGLRITPEQQSGLELSGNSLVHSLAGRDAELRYSLYLGYGSDTELLDHSQTRGPSFGADLRLTSADDVSFLGVSLYQQKRDLERDRTERSVMLYGQLPLAGPLLLRGEYVHQRRDDRTQPGLAREIDIAYAQLRWQLSGRSYLSYRFNWGDDDGGGAAEKHYVHAFTLGFQPTERLRLKLEYADHELRHGPRRSFRYWGASIGLLF